MFVMISSHATYPENVDMLLNNGLVKRPEGEILFAEVTIGKLCAPKSFPYHIRSHISRSSTCGSVLLWPAAEMCLL